METKARIKGDYPFDMLKCFVHFDRRNYSTYFLNIGDNWSAIARLLVLVCARHRCQMHLVVLSFLVFSLPTISVGLLYSIDGLYTVSDALSNFNCMYVCIWSLENSYLYDMMCWFGVCPVPPLLHRPDILSTTPVNSAWPFLRRRRNDHWRKLRCKQAWHATRYTSHVPAV